ncbi:hypothetical protein WEH80_27030 [Actinomycetes bacterium KLBMP 9759]
MLVYRIPAGWTAEPNGSHLPSTGHAILFKTSGVNSEFTSMSIEQMTLPVNRSLTEVADRDLRELLRTASFATLVQREEICTPSFSMLLQDMDFIPMERQAVRRFARIGFYLLRRTEGAEGMRELAVATLTTACDSIVTFADAFKELAYSLDFGISTSGVPDSPCGAC